MSITTTLSKANYITTLKSILYEWLTDDSCFGTDGSTVKVINYSETQSDKQELIVVEYALLPSLVESTGFGRQGTNAEFRTHRARIRFKAARSGGPKGRENRYAMEQQEDTLHSYYQSSSGIPALGSAGLEMAALTGPYEIEHKHYYIDDYFLTFRTEVA